jgi:hypothetical protein
MRVAQAPEPARLVTDPDSPYYDVTTDPASIFYVGPPAGDHLSGDEIRAQVTDMIYRFLGPPGGFLDLLFGSMKESLIQSAYQDRVMSARDGLAGDMRLRTPGEAPKTLWVNASHEQMVEVINSNADSSVVAVSSEEWVRLGNDLSEHQRAFGGAINDSLGNWQGEAGDAARTHLAAVARWLGSTAEGSVLTGRQQEIHSQALSETQKAMANNPPVPFSAPEANARLAGITDPVQFATQLSAEMDTYHRQQVARDHAAQLMLRFDDTIAGAVTTPRFTPPPSLLRTTTPSLTRSSTDQVDLRRDFLPAGGVPQGGGDPVRDGGVPAGHLPGDDPTVTGGDGPAFGGGVPGGKAFAPTASTPAGSIPHAAALSGGFPGGVVPGGAGGGTGVPSVPQLPNVSPSGGLDGSTGTAGFTSAGSIPTANVPRLPRGTTVPSRFSGGGGIVPTPGYTPPPFSRPSGNDGERTTRLTTGGQGRPTVPTVPNLPDGRGFGPGGTPPIGGGPGAGGGRSVTPGGGAPSGGMPGGRGGFGPMGSGSGPGAAASGPRGAGAPVGGPGAGGGAGGRGDDKEYQVAGYLEGDSELFAPGKVVSPPVIGDWNNQEDWK